MIRTGTLLENRYEILGKLGSGGMADVYKAKCRKLGRYVAVKVLKPEYSNDESFVAKFRAEAQAAAGLVHPNVVNVYDVGDEKDLHYIVLEMVEGITLKQYIEKKGKLEIRESIGIAMQIAQGMEAAHERRIVHRDIKPQNIMISKDGKVKVTDFGIAKATSTQTINSATMGSVHYISPEQARGGYCDERSDIYSLGVTMYEMLTGHVPYEGDSAVAIALMHIQEEMDSPLKYDSMIPISLEKIIMKCTQKKPEQRYANVSLLIADLRRALMTPDEDFVKIVPLASTGATRVMSEDEMSQIKDGYTHDDIEPEEPDFVIDEEQDYLLGFETDLDDFDEDSGDDEDISDEEDEEEESKFEKTAIGVFIGVAVVILLLVIYLLLQFFGVIGNDDKPTDSSTEPSYETSSEYDEESTEETEDANKTVKMPDLSDMTEEEIEKALNKLGLVPKFRYQESAEVKEGYIISQANKEGEEIKRGATVQIVISAGTDVVTLPNDLSGKTTDEVRTILANLELGSTVAYDYSNTIPKGKVIRTTPGEGTVVAKGRSVTVYESMGVKPTVTIPDLSGKTRAQAAALLDGLKLKVTYTEEYNDDIKKDYVVSQSIDANKKVDENSELTVVISKGPESVEMPDLVTGDLSYEEAVKILEELGLKVKDISLTYRNDKALGDFDQRVIIQYPEAKVPVDENSTIYLNIVRTVVEKMDPLVGKTATDAKKLLTDYGMKVTVKEVACTKEEVGKVIYAKFADGTNVPVNTTVAVGSSITLTVGKGTEAVIPSDLIGKSYSEVEKILKEDYKVNVKRGADVYSSTVAKDKVAVITPAAGSTVKVGDTVTVQVSLGQLTMPDVIGKTYDAAVAILQAAPYNLTVIKDARYNSEVASGVVYNQSKQAGASLTSGATVTLTVSLGAEPVTTAKVPAGLVGKTYDEAASALSAVGLTAQKEEVYSDSVAAGLVISASKAEGTEVDLGTTITLTVSLGPEPTEAPTEPSTEAPTEESTEAPTEESTEAPTEASTEESTEATTEAAGASVGDETEASTEAAGA